MGSAVAINERKKEKTKENKMMDIRLDKKNADNLSVPRGQHTPAKNTHWGPTFRNHKPVILSHFPLVFHNSLASTLIPTKKKLCQLLKLVEGTIYILYTIYKLVEGIYIKRDQHLGCT